MKTKLLFLESKDKEMIVAWSNFADPVMRNEQFCESVQYMGTVIRDALGALQVVHQFRHRALPVTNERKYWEYKASPAFMVRVKAGEFDSVEALEMGL